MFKWWDLAIVLIDRGCKNPRDHIDRLRVLAKGGRVSIYFHKCLVLVGEA